jgi:hypothetical protein
MLFVLSFSFFSLGFELGFRREAFPFEAGHAGGVI